jgi:hypothetical protein
LVERKVRSAVVAGLNDPAASAKCFEAGAGRRLRLSMGATIEKRFGPPLEAEVEVVRLVANPRRVVGRIGDVEVILADGPTAFTDARQVEPCGLDPLSRKLVVVKEGYPTSFGSPNGMASRWAATRRSRAATCPVCAAREAAPCSGANFVRRRPESVASRTEQPRHKNPRPDHLDAEGFAQVEQVPVVADQVTGSGAQGRSQHDVIRGPRCQA